VIGLVHRECLADTICKRGQFPSPPPLHRFGSMNIIFVYYNYPNISYVNIIQEYQLDGCSKPLHRIGYTLPLNNILFSF